MKNTLKPKQFAIAKNNNGTIGLITSTGMVETLTDVGLCNVWSGVVLEDSSYQRSNGRGETETIPIKKGELWFSASPVVISHSTPESIMENSFVTVDNDGFIDATMFIYFESFRIWTSCKINHETGEIVHEKTPERYCDETDEGMTAIDICFSEHPTPFNIGCLEFYNIGHQNLETVQNKYKK